MNVLRPPGDRQRLTAQARATPRMTEGRQAARSAATRAKLLRAARSLFARHGYAAVGTEQIVRRAGVTRGALYHHFADKDDLLLAVYEQVEQELTEELGQRAASASSPREALAIGAELFLDACARPEIQRIVLLDAPAVLGWERWREVGSRYGLGLIEGVLGAGMESGEFAAGPLKPLAHALLGAVDELALWVARADDPEQARADAGAVVRQLLVALEP